MPVFLILAFCFSIAHFELLASVLLIFLAVGIASADFNEGFADFLAFRDGFA